MAETISCTLWVPIDVIKERLQVQSRITASQETKFKLKYKSDFDAVKQIAKKMKAFVVYIEVMVLH